MSPSASGMLLLHLVSFRGENLEEAQAGMPVSRSGGCLPSRAPLGLSTHAARSRILSEPINILKGAGWVDATAPNSVIDYVLTRSLDHWEVGEIEVADDEVASDHPAVLVELKWSSEA